MLLLMEETAVLDAAAISGFTLSERVLDRRRVWGWRRGDDTRHPCFLTRTEAVAYMADWLRRGAIFER
jgi:hypothetical protein